MKVTHNQSDYNKKFHWQPTQKGWVCERCDKNLWLLDNQLNDTTKTTAQSNGFHTPMSIDNRKSGW